jgi:hypothetical protein
MRLKSPIARLWVAFALNCAALVFLVIFYMAFHREPKWDSEYFAYLVLLVGNAWAVIGGFVSLLLLQPYALAHRTNTWKCGDAFALVTLPLGFMLSGPYSTANIIEYYVMYGLKVQSDWLILFSGMATYFAVAFLVGAVMHRIATSAPKWYMRAVIGVIGVLTILQVLSISYGTSHWAGGFQ